MDQASRPIVNHQSSADVKIRLFRSLFRGRDDVYPTSVRESEDGQVRIYDYADLNAAMLARMFDRRCRGYEAVGYTIPLPACAIPGWPADVILPSDPVWKRDYSGSVRYLGSRRPTVASRGPS
jgi:hypothetical protein